MSVPNIFKYATKELSQDALICWAPRVRKGAGRKASRVRQGVRTGAVQLR